MRGRSPFWSARSDIEVPTLASLSEIETSSRLRTEKDWLHLSIPMIYRADGFMPALTPLGFVLVEGPSSDGSFQAYEGFRRCKETIPQASAAQPEAQAP